MTLTFLFWSLFPVIVYFACNFVSSYFSLQERFKIKTVDLAVPFLLIGLSELSREAFQRSIVPFVLISILLIAVFVVVYLAYQYHDLQYAKLFKMTWRITFLYIIAIYIFVIIAGLFV